MLLESVTSTNATPLDRNPVTQIRNICIGNTEGDFEIRNSFDLHLTDLDIGFGKTERI